MKNEIESHSASFNELLRECRSYSKKNPIDYLRNTLTLICTKAQEIYLKNFFSNYRKNI